jgi:mitochondrial chaperone BCS1
MSSLLSEVLKSSNTALLIDLASRIVSRGGNLQNALESTVPGFKLLRGYILRRSGFDITRLLTFGAVGIAVLRYAWVHHVYPYILDSCTSSVLIRAEDSLSNAVANYLAQRYMTKRGSRFISAVSASSEHDNDSREDDATYDASSGIQYFPSVGSHWFLFGYWPFMFEHRCEDTELTLDHTVNSIKPKKEDVAIVIRCIGWNAAPLRSFLASVQTWAEEQNQKRAVTEVWVPHLNKDWLGYWRGAKFIMSRPLHTVELDAEIKGPIVKDLERFLDPAAKKYYKEQGIPYRRGYLFYGPPGTGKSSLARALAGHFQLILCVIGLSTEGMTGTVLTGLFNRLPKRCIVLLEDIDSAGIKTRAELKRIAADANMMNRKVLDAEAEGITLADLLNVVDGTMAVEGRILILSTNTPEILDSAMIRAGRIDRQVPMLAMSKACACSIFKRMFSKADAGNQLSTLAERFASNLPEGQITAAEIQGFLLDHRDNPFTAASSVEAWATALVTAKEKGQNIVRDGDSEPPGGGDANIDSK